MKAEERNSIATAEALMDTLTSSTTLTSSGDPANATDALIGLNDAVVRVARAISDDAVPGEDATGGSVGCLTEALMGHTAALVQIAGAIYDLAQAVRDHGDTE